jgi:hypothetical protein
VCKGADDRDVSETNESPKVELHLTNARESIERGDWERALDELWHAEAVARSNPEVLQQILDFVAAPGFSDSLGESASLSQPLSRQSVVLADLAAALRRDIRAARGSPAIRQSEPSDLGCLALAALGLVGGIVGAVVGGAIGNAIAPRFGLAFAHYILVGGLIGLFVGMVALPVLVFLGSSGRSLEGHPS